MSDKTKCVIALGYFDGVHLGHKKVIQTARKIADESGAKLLVFSFGGNLRSKLKCGEGTFIFDKEERKRIYLSLKADEVLFAPVNATFLSKGKRAFLNFINKRYNICHYVCGKDYRFGKLGKGNVADIIKYAKEKKQQVEIVVEIDNVRVSSTLVKEYLKKGEIKKANKILSEDYSITAKVVSGRKMGKILGFPTANFNLEEARHKLKLGFYSGRVIIEKKEYKTIINYGNCPTFNQDNVLVETHILGYEGNLYGKKLTVYFTDYLREIQKFSSKEELLAQIQKDKENALNG